MNALRETSLLYGQSLALLTDLYQLTMVYGYWKAGLAERQAVFHLNFRRWPFQGGFAIAAGLETAAQFLQHFTFSQSDLTYLASLKNDAGDPLFEEAFLYFLSEFRFACDLDAMPEGSLAFPYDPLIRVKGPIWQAQLLESPMLNLINFQTLIATKAARICLAAEQDSVIEFGIRRAQGIDGAISASRAAYIGGCCATSDVIAGKLFGIPVKGTHAHSWVMAFDEEKIAFETFARIMPKGCIMLVDTYDSLQGVKTAMEAARILKHQGFELSGVRLDSGDLACLSVEIRKLLDEEGFAATAIMASNELDEYLIRDLKQQGAKITIWGVGTNLVTGKDQPALDGVYKLSAIQNEKGEWIHRLKVSEQMAKATNPGILQIRRFFDGQFYLADAIYDELGRAEDPLEIVGIQDPNIRRLFTETTSYSNVLVPIFKKGRLVYGFPPLASVQSYAKQELARLPPNKKRFINPEPYFAGLEKGLYQKKLALIRKWRKSSWGKL